MDLWDGGTTVTIIGANLGDGGYHQCDPVRYSRAIIQSQSATQVVVVTGASPALRLGDVRVYSVSYGETVKSNAFNYSDQSGLGIARQHDYGEQWGQLEQSD